MRNKINKNIIYNNYFNIYRLKKLYAICLIITSLYSLIGCSTTSYGHSHGDSAVTLDCAVMRYNGSFSKYGSIIDPSILPENARGIFVKEGTHAIVDKAESSWDFENGYRARIYVRIPVQSHWRSFFLEKSFDKEVSKSEMIDFVRSSFSSCAVPSKVSKAFFLPAHPGKSTASRLSNAAALSHRTRAARKLTRDDPFPAQDAARPWTVTAIL